MTEPSYQHAGVTLYTGSALALLAELPAASVQTIVTSPPYFGMRDYDSAPQVWGGRADCPHVWGQGIRLDKRGSGTDDGTTGRQRGERYARNAARGAFCLRCSAWCGELGREPTPALYVQHLSAVLVACQRVLAPDGTLWLNLGDSYANDAKGGGRTGGKHAKGLHGAAGLGRDRVETGLKPKELMGIPWRVAFALMDAGFTLRSDVIWYKPNPMPEPHDDRPTKGHEYVFLFSQADRYVYDWRAIAEPPKRDWRKGAVTSREGRAKQQQRGASYHPHTAAAPPFSKPADPAGVRARTVWEIVPASYPGAHFAVMPNELARRCILAGSRPGDCVLDPFSGTATTALVARSLDRRAVGIELRSAYQEMAVARLAEPLLEWGAQQEAAQQAAFALMEETG